MFGILDLNLYDYSEKQARAERKLSRYADDDFNRIRDALWNTVQQAEVLVRELQETAAFIRPPSPHSILIVTVTKVEAQAVLKVFSQAASKKWTRKAIGSKTYYDLGIHGGASVFMVQSEMGIAGPAGALLTVRQAIQDLRPQAVIMCGICMAYAQTSRSWGIYWSPGSFSIMSLRKWIPGKVRHHGDRVTSAERLLDHFRSGDLEWAGASTHFGLMLSGEKLVNDSAFCDRLLQVEPEAVGGEMEGAGLYAAARDAKVDWILVKAICDWADGSKNDDAQSLAASNAAQFVLHVLELGGWSDSEQSIPLTQGITEIAQPTVPELPIKPTNIFNRTNLRP